MRPSRLWPVIGALLVLGALAGYQFAKFGRSDETTTPTVPAVPIFELVLTDVKGQTQSLGQWRGKVLVLNYWATWCHPCREEMPGFSRLQDRYRDKGIQFVGISIDTADKITEFEKLTPVSYPLLIGDIGVMENSAKLGNTRQALPFTAVFDRQGRLAATKLGRYAEADLERLVLELVSR